MIKMLASAAVLFDNAGTGSGLRPFEMLTPMTLRFLLNRTALAAGLAIAFVPTTYSQSTKPATPADQQSAYQGEVVEDIVARVNAQVISRTDYDRAAQDLEGQAKQQQWT